VATVSDSSVRGPASADRWGPALAAAVVGGLAVGTVARGLDHLASPSAHWLSALGAPWLAVAFAVGAFGGSRRAGAAAGALALALGVGVYYLLFHFVEHRASGGYMVTVGLGWALGALPAGAVFGWAGAAWWHRRGPASTAVLAGALLGEALLLRTIWSRPVALRILVLEAGVALACALLLTRERVRALGATAVVAVACLVVELIARDALRGVGWAGR
jgi:hypothetical protein